MPQWIDVCSGVLDDADEHWEDDQQAVLAPCLRSCASEQWNRWAGLEQTLMCDIMSVVATACGARVHLYTAMA